MSWKFDPFIMNLIWVAPIPIVEDVGDIDLGTMDSDLMIDMGSREDSPSGIDQGLRVYDGNF
jgi:hypothetical protein